MIGTPEVLFRLVLAALLGGAVGYEREIHGRPAGIRTHLILSLGSALIMIISEYLSVGFRLGSPGTIVQVDPGRIAAQAVTGIGFLGAGVILRHKDSIRGLTTAACVWTTCAVGLAIGAGFYVYGAAVTAITILALVGIKAMEQRLRKDWYQEISIVSQDLPGVLGRIQDIIVSHHYQVLNSGVTKDLEKREIKADFELRVRTVHPSWHVLQEIFDIPGVKSVDLS